MKIPGIKLAAMVAASAVLLGGCGEEPYELTDNENKIIVNYAAHILMKYDLNQNEGLQFVWLNTEEDIPEDDGTEAVEDSGDTGDSGDVAGDGLSDGGQTAEDEAVYSSLEELFGSDSLSVEYAGAELADSYVESDYYALSSAAGKQYLALYITVANNGSGEAEMDNLDADPWFYVSLDGETTIAQEFTVLMEDFSTWQGTIAEGETVQTVLLFLVPDTVTDIGDLSLSVSVYGNNYQIIL